jgi:hypothetical protein
MPIELESGELQLTVKEIVIYLPASELIATAFSETFPLYKPITRSQFTVLCIAHNVINGDEAMIRNTLNVLEDEIAKRNYQLH